MRKRERLVSLLADGEVHSGADMARAMSCSRTAVWKHLRELRSLDHQHWSRLLAETVQDEIRHIHPGTNRGVKQGPLAVITNALMPAVLIEIGFLSHAEEGPLLGQESFQKDAAGAIAEAVRRFFRRYPPGSGEGA